MTRGFSCTCKGWCDCHHDPNWPKGETCDCRLVQDKPYDFARGERLYSEMAVDFLCNWLYPFCPAIPDYTRESRPSSPCDDFCNLNPGLLQTFAKFLSLRDYELSEHQCSWACLKYRAEVRSWWD